MKFLYVNLALPILAVPAPKTDITHTFLNEPLPILNNDQPVVDVIKNIENVVDPLKIFNEVRDTDRHYYDRGFYPNRYWDNGSYRPKAQSWYDNTYRYPSYENWRPQENTWKPVKNTWKPVENTWKPLENTWKPLENTWKPAPNKFNWLWEDKPVWNKVEKANWNYDWNREYVPEPIYNVDPLPTVKPVDIELPKPIEWEPIRYNYDNHVNHVNYEPWRHQPVRTYRQQNEFDPMMWYFMSKNNNDNNDFLLPLLMSNGQHQGQMDPLMMLALMEDETKSCESLFSVTDKAVSNPTIKHNDPLGTLDLSKVDYKYIGCLYHRKQHDTKGDNGFLLPLMMMNGGQGNLNQQMNPLMMMALSDNKDMKSLLPLLMGGGLHGGNGQMDPLMMMMMVDYDSKKTCEDKYNIPNFFYEYDTLNDQIHIVTFASTVKAHWTGVSADYKTCVEKPVVKDDDNDLLTMLMLMGGFNY